MRKVVVTGIGAVSPIGNTAAAFCAGLRTGASGVDHITAFDASGYEVSIAAEVKGFDPGAYIDKKEARKMARFSQFAAAAALEALSQAGLLDGTRRYAADPERAAVILGNGIGGFEIVSESFKKLFDQGPDRMPPLTVPMMIANEAAANVSLLYGLKGAALTQVTACASGADALGQALDFVRCGRAEVVVSGGTEATTVPFAVGGFSMLKTLSTKYNKEPHRASRPFDAERDGFVLGEGAGILVLESEEHAKKRGANILAEFAGYGVTADSYHLTSPDPSGESGARALRLCLQDAGLRPEDVQYYNAHGTSTRINDATETRMLHIAFGEHVRKLKVSSIKSMIGHCIAGGGGLEAIACILAINEGFFPPTINYENPDPECDLDYVPNKAQTGKIDVALSANMGFGGHNGVVAFRRTI
ncbi:MAG: beta-ketoacyl-ACP synthase II [Spirochaetaceae bacterium]|nr:beta-ketoacyl-ACP synthase II [Spirochaetaceae bacterium]